MKNALSTAAVALSALIAYTGSTIDPADSAQPAADSISAMSVAADPGQQLDQLTVAARGSMDGYSRAKYPHWTDQVDSCNTREVVLKRDGEGVKTGSDCKPTSGTWESRYDGATRSDPADLDIDHMVPLGNSWVSGAKE